MRIIQLPKSRSLSTPKIHQVSNIDFLKAVLENPKKIHYTSATILNEVEGNEYEGDDNKYEAATVSQLIQAIHQAFSEHVCLGLKPDVFWYAIIHEIAILVKSNPTKYAYLFTNAPNEQKLLVVRDDSLVYDGKNDWLRSINLIRDPLRNNMTEFAIQLFMPTFTTSTLESETAILVSFMDVISKYYKFKWLTKCGIPEIRLEGEATDWAKLVSQTVSLSEVFPELKSYFNDLIPVLQEIAKTAQGLDVDQEFWCSLYKYNKLSGTNTVSGWITALSAYKQTEKGFELKEKFDWYKQSRYDGINTNHFASHVSTVPFIWDYYGKQIKMAFAAGVIAVDYDKFLTPRLGFAVFEP